jgi:hypothetical protein
MFEKGNTFSQGRKIGSHSEQEIQALKERNAARKGQPITSEKMLAASRAGCKAMNAVRHLKAGHILENVDSVALTGDCHICGQVPIKVMKHRANGALRDQYLCWVGTRCRETDGAPAKVAYKNQALEMWNNQHGNCALCYKYMVRAGNTNEGATLDHCHTTGFIRGFIHQGCNKGLGHFLDDPEVLKMAAEYLLR